MTSVSENATLRWHGGGQFLDVLVNVEVIVLYEQQLSQTNAVLPSASAVAEQNR